MLPKKNYISLSKSTLTPPTKEVMAIIRVYLCQKITSPCLFDEFSEDAITLLAHYVYRVICFLVGKMKTILTLQRRTIPNALHGVLAIHSTGVEMNSFLSFLQQRLEDSLRGQNMGIFQRQQISGLMNQFSYLFQQEIEEYEKPNIYNIPNFCHQIRNPLPLQINFTPSFTKPHPLSYLETHQKTKAHNTDPEIVQQKIVDAEKQIKVCLGQVRKIRKSDNNQREQSQHKKALKACERGKAKSFKMCDYV